MSQKKPETSKSIARNVLYNFSTWVLPLGLSFFATPIIVKALGDVNYGIYALVLGFIGYSFNFGIGRAVTKYVAEYRASGESEKITEVISATFVLNTVIGFLGVLVICLSANWLVAYVFKIHPDVHSKTVNAFFIAAAIIFLTGLNQVFTAVLQGLYRFDVYSKIAIFNSVALLVGNIVLALRGYGLVVLLTWNLFILIIVCLLNAVSAKRLLPEFGINLNFRWKTLKVVLKFSSGVIGCQILANVLLLFERGWTIRNLGAESLTYYVVPMILSLYIQSFVATLVLVVFPLASELKDDKERLLKLYTKATKIITLLVVFMASTLIIQSKTFLTLWMGAEFAEKASALLVIHTITFSLTAILGISWQMTEGMGFPNFNFKIYAVCLVLCVFLMVSLTESFGTIGIAISRMTGFVVMFLSIFYVEKWFFGKVQVRLWLLLVGILGISTILAMLAEELIIANFSISWLVLIAATFCGAIVYFFTAWALGFISEDERRLVKHIFTN